MPQQYELPFDLRFTVDEHYIIKALKQRLDDLEHQRKADRQREEAARIARITGRAA